MAEGSFQIPMPGMTVMYVWRILGTVVVVRPAIVVRSWTTGICWLSIFTEAGVLFREEVAHAAYDPSDAREGTWHWPSWSIGK